MQHNQLTDHRYQRFSFPPKTQKRILLQPWVQVTVNIIFQVNFINRPIIINDLYLMNLADELKKVNNVIVLRPQPQPSTKTEALQRAYVSTPQCERLSATRNFLHKIGDLSITYAKRCLLRLVAEHSQQLHVHVPRLSVNLLLPE